MKAMLKGLACDEVDVDNYKPADSDCFNIRLIARIGPSDHEGSDYFEFYVCTADWLRNNINYSFWGRNHLVVKEFDIMEIRNAIEILIEANEAETWSGVAKKLSAYMSWEYEDYTS